MEKTEERSAPDIKYMYTWRDSALVFPLSSLDRSVGREKIKKKSYRQFPNKSGAKISTQVG